VKVEEETFFDYINLRKEKELADDIFKRES
jgi:hypothetical protein